MGVAVTVGLLSRMTTRLRIADVSGVAIGPTARLNILLRNTGQTFTHGQGQASCTAAGRRHTFPVSAATVLPHDQAEIAGQRPWTPGGDDHALLGAARLRPRADRQLDGLGHRACRPAARIVHTGPGAYSVIPPDTIPAWAIALIVIGALALLTMAVLLLRTRRRSRFP